MYMYLIHKNASLCQVETLFRMRIRRTRCTIQDRAGHSTRCFLHRKLGTRMFLILSRIFQHVFIFMFDFTNKEEILVNYLMIINFKTIFQVCDFFKYRILI